MCLLIDYDIKIRLNKIVCNPLSVGGDPREDCRGADAASVGAARHHAHYHEGMLRALAGQERTSRVSLKKYYCEAQEKRKVKGRYIVGKQGMVTKTKTIQVS